jgi:glycosyltransferase involved in cell wall biosynthesis
MVPSIYPEGFSRVVLESLCCGLPVIGSDMGCIPEETSPSCSILVPPTVENLRKAVLSLMSDRVRLAEMSREARRFGEARYSERNMDSLVAAYEVAGTEKEAPRGSEEGAGR